MGLVGRNDYLASLLSLLSVCRRTIPVNLSSSLFWVILYLTLLLSWFTAISTTPLLCALLIKTRESR